MQIELNNIISYSINQPNIFQDDFENTKKQNVRNIILIKIKFV